ncbi:hypothetical protein [Rhizobium sp. SGZ-381]|uniref:hypothetical protein n=1 Tax=Rhizobium sp. SGZ-381 TaxID=3342800 RepID=UPI00366F65B0
MASAETFDAFKGVLDAEWTATALVFENETGQELVEAGLPFVYVEIYGSSYDQQSVGSPGSNLWLEQGSTWLHVMVPSGKGSRQARIWAKQLIDLFREQSIIAVPATGEQLFMPEMSIGAGEPGRDFPQYFAMTATIQWYRRDYNT